MLVISKLVPEVLSKIHLEIKLDLWCCIGVDVVRFFKLILRLEDFFAVHVTICEVKGVICDNFLGF